MDEEALQERQREIADSAEEVTPLPNAVIIKIAAYVQDLEIADAAVAQIEVSDDIHFIWHLSQEHIAYERVCQAALKRLFELPRALFRQQARGEYRLGIIADHVLQVMDRFSVNSCIQAQGLRLMDRLYGQIISTRRGMPDVQNPVVSERSIDIICSGMEKLPEDSYDFQVMLRVLSKIQNPALADESLGGTLRSAFCCRNIPSILLKFIKGPPTDPYKVSTSLSLMLDFVSCNDDPSVRSTVQSYLRDHADFCQIIQDVMSLWQSDAATPAAGEDPYIVKVIFRHCREILNTVSRLEAR